MLAFKVISVKFKIFRHPNWFGAIQNRSLVFQKRTSTLQLMPHRENSRYVTWSVTRIWKIFSYRQDLVDVVCGLLNFGVRGGDSCHEFFSVTLRLEALINPDHEATKIGHSEQFVIS